MSWAKPSIFASDEWITKPFLIHNKTPIDRVNDVLLQLPECLVIRLQMQDARDRALHTREGALRHLLEDRLSSFLSRLNVYWTEYKEDTNSDYDHSLYFELSNFVSHPDDWVVTSTRGIIFQDALAATTIPDYDAAVVIVSMILIDVQPELSIIHLQRMAIHCASILEAIRTHSNLGPDSGGDVSLVFAMKTVYRFTPCKEQKDRVKLELEEWGKRRGVDAISQLWDIRFVHESFPKSEHWEEPSQTGGPSERIVDIS